jgi:methylenetetrahydrofolate reductase (NADPH)
LDGIGLRIDELLKGRQTVSFEIFPPKLEVDADLSKISRAISDMKSAAPDFISVTYGAGGNNRPRALDIAGIVLSNGMNPLSHLTAVGYTNADASRVLDSLDDLGVTNVLALRGDAPKDMDADRAWKEYGRASDLVRYVAELKTFCVGGAAYPEGHQRSVSREADIEYMKEKERAGASFFITQLFFDNDAFFSFAEDVSSSGVKAPLIAGIMPVFKAPQIRRIVEISGCRVPAVLSDLLDKYNDDDESMREAGIDYAACQITALWRNGVKGVHIYTMNRSKGVIEILKRCGLFERDAPQCGKLVGPR